jgi:cation diffusion facilitator family transporter
MHYKSLELWQHAHDFGQGAKRAAERRTLAVIAITGTMMVVEIAAGAFFGSMALLADGLHMASHAAALSISAFAYIYARRHAHDPGFCFGTGKANALGGFTGAVLLAVFALLMAGESLNRLFNPVSIAFSQAILVAVLGLVVNGVSMLILGNQGHEHHHHEESSDHGHHHHDEASEHEHKHQHGDHNLRSAYLHVLADALTSVLAIFALLAARYLNMAWMDPLMGIVGAIMVARWSVGLLRLTSAVLLDRQAPAQIWSAVKDGIEGHDDNRVADLHLWSVGPDIYAAIVSVISRKPRAPDWYKTLIPGNLGLVHVTVEVHRCPDED